MVNLRTTALLIGGISVIGVLFYGVTTARAETDPPLDETHKERIIAQCTSAKATLQQLHRSDASLRVDRGRLYEFMSTKLMGRLNSRLALNRLDAGSLVAIAARYEKTFSDFRDAYQRYEEQLSTTLRTDCTNQPEQFYYRVVDAQKKRKTVNDRAQDLRNIAGEFYRSFEQFSKDFQESNKEVDRG